MTVTPNNYIGSFLVESGKIVVSDPCYEKGIWCAYIIDAENGCWNAYLPLDGNRPDILYAFLDGYGTDCFSEELDGAAGVDSGQMSIWDADDYTNERNRYESICDDTLDHNYSIQKYGVASSTKYGDGGYPVDVYYAEGSNKAVGIAIDFA